MGDYIDRDLLMDEIDHITITAQAKEIGMIQRELDKVLYAINNAPSVNAPTLGHWVEDPSVEWKCSVCGGMRLMIRSLYCPWCGADMADVEGEQ